MTSSMLESPSRTSIAVIVTGDDDHLIIPFRMPLEGLRRQPLTIYDVSPMSADRGRRDAEMPRLAEMQAAMNATASIEAFTSTSSKRIIGNEKFLAEQIGYVLTNFS